jgi:hypothetical protein
MNTNAKKELFLEQKENVALGQKESVTFVTQQFVQYSRNDTPVSEKLRVTVPTSDLEHLTLDGIKAHVSALLRKEYAVDFSVDTLENNFGKIQATYQIMSPMAGKEFTMSGTVKTPERQAQLDELKNEKAERDRLIAVQSERQAEIEDLENRTAQLKAEQALDAVKIDAHQARIVGLVKQLRPDLANKPAVRIGTMFESSKNKHVQTVAHANEKSDFSITAG